MLFFTVLVNNMLHLYHDVFKRDKLSLFITKTVIKAKLYRNSGILPNHPRFSQPGKKACGKHCGKGENACNQHFLLFPKCFPLY